MKLTEIQELIKFVAKSGVSEVDIETKDLKINIKTMPKGRKGAEEQTLVQTTVPVAAIPQTMVAQPQSVAVAEAPAPAKESKEEKPASAEKTSGTEIKSPMIGTFYRSPSPDKPAFVNVGDEIKQGDVICIIEAMKLFNEIEAEVSGKVVKVLVDDASPVEYEQPLFIVEPL
ncbi:MAG: acetyl-CoA carboxylase biotin carboxyl carrier protein [Flavobacteriales bacterium]|nr:acetyl-CoA carboxylase biotin carboxyl carrier protein [Flavobacteriales bacterium]